MNVSNGVKWRFNTDETCVCTYNKFSILQSI